jgi:hypothetical protein
MAMGDAAGSSKRQPLHRVSPSFLDRRHDRIQAKDLIAQLRAVLAGHGQFLDIIMPDGKKMSDCGGQYVGEVSEALHARIACEDVIETTGTSRRTAA